MNSKIKWDKKELEDSKDVYNWRWQYANNITQMLYNNYYIYNNGIGRKIDKIWVQKSNFYEGYLKRYKNGSKKKNRDYILLFYMHTMIKVKWKSI